MQNKQTNKMCPLRRLCFVLLICFLESVTVQSSDAPCTAPALDGGYFVPKKDMYSHGSDLTYACDDGRKPTMEGWWAIIKCQNGEWSQTPECIEDNKCNQPDIPDGHVINPKPWYAEGERIRIECIDGYESQHSRATAICNNGSWTSIPICEKSSDTCDNPPPKITDGIITQGYKKLFASDSYVSYTCKDGYGVEETVSQQRLYCIQGEWSKPSLCMGRASRPDVGAGGPVNAGPNVGGGPVNAGPNVGGGPVNAGPNVGGGPVNAGPNVGGGPVNAGPNVGGGPVNAGHNVGGEPTVGGGSGTSATQPPGGPGQGGGGVSAGSVPNPGGSGLYAAIETCGDIQPLENGDFEKTSVRSLTYQCNVFHKLEGTAVVVCFNDGTWSQLPTCKANYCTVQRNTQGLKPLPSDYFMKNGEYKDFECLNPGTYSYVYQQYIHYSRIRCDNGIPRYVYCCSGYESLC